MIGEAVAAAEGDLLELFRAYLALEEPVPSDIDRLADLGGPLLPDPVSSLTTSLRHWALVTGRGGKPSAAEVA